MNNFQGAEHADSVYSNYLSGSIVERSMEEKAKPRVAAERAYSEEELGYRATCEESYDIMAQTIAIYANYPNALYSL
ncbi:MAG: hypothetical protein AAF597_08235 [Bacteroidota bacterium]